VRTATPTPAPAADLWIYRDALLSPWQSWSWSAKVYFNDTSKKYAGTRSIKVVQNAWGALSLENGPGGLDPSRYSAVSFAVNGGASGIRLGVMLEDAASDAFPEIDLGNIPANTWRVVSVPMSQLNPAGKAFDRVDIQHIGNAGRTYWVDELKLVGK